MTSPGAADGDHTLYFENDASRPYTVYCSGMASGSPSEYLNVNSATNYAFYPCVGWTSGTDATKTWSRIRVTYKAEYGALDVTCTPTVLAASRTPTTILSTPCAATALARLPPVRPGWRR